MLIDFHTHVFPDKIAAKTVAFLAEKSNMTPFSDGTVEGLLKRMEEGDADIAVTLPVLTSPAQFDSVNKFAAQINETFKDKKRRLISFAGIHPLCEDIDKKMSFIKENGFLGVKIHPDYQDSYITDGGYVKIMECAKEYDLTVVTHSGVDAGYRDKDVRCTPKLVKELIRKVPHKKFVLAHYGANEMFREVLDTLCGEDLYFDTACVLNYISPEMFKAILEKHGEDKILFATDSPWSDISRDRDIIKSFSLGKNTEEKLFFKNAKALLGI